MAWKEKHEQENYFKLFINYNIHFGKSNVYNCPRDERKNRGHGRKLYSANADAAAIDQMERNNNRELWNIITILSFFCEIFADVDFIQTQVYYKYVLHYCLYNMRFREFSFIKIVGTYTRRISFSVFHYVYIIKIRITIYLQILE